MTQGPNRLLDDFAKLMTDAAGVAQGARRLEVAPVAHVHQVEDSVGQDEGPPRAEPLETLGQLLAREDLLGGPSHEEGRRGGPWRRARRISRRVRVAVPRVMAASTSARGKFSSM